MKKLVIAEKPSVGRDIARVLGCRQSTKNYIEGKEYIVTWGLGHLVTLADPEGYDKKYQSWKIEDLPIMPQHLKLVVIPQTRGQFKTVKTLIDRKDVDEIIIATDAGREGELVARWILQKAGNKKPAKRLWISSVTDKAILDGFRQLKSAKAYDNLYRAATARAEADWLVGINATRALTCKYNAQLSCGRVQTPTLAMIAAREEEIRKFQPQVFYGISLLSQGVHFTWRDGKSGSSQTFSRERAEEICQKMKGQTPEVTEVRKIHKSMPAPGLYDLTLLQREANQRFGFSAKQTLSLLQNLYEHHKIVTYPRTDSRYITQDVVPTLKERLKAISVGPYRTYAASILKAPIKSNKSFVDDKKVSDHHALIPTEQPVILDALSYEERKLYDMIVRRFLAVLYPQYEYEHTSITISCAGEKFVASGDIMKAAGFRKVLYPDQVEKAQSFPSLQQGQLLQDSKVTISQGKTTAPSRFNEGSLLEAMENPVKYMANKDQSMVKTIRETGGLGTVATRADIIDKLFRSFYIEKKGQDIYLTGKAKQLLKLVPQDLRQPELTASWESKLSDIAAGKLRQDSFMTEIRGYANSLTEEVIKGDGSFRHDNLTNKVCPDCGKRMLSVNGKHGKMLVCQDRSCGYKETISRLTNARCPVCHKKMELIGQKEQQKFVCVCGHKESMKAFEERKKKAGAGVSKKDVANYMKKMKKEEKQPLNNGLAAALANLKL